MRRVLVTQPYLASYRAPLWDLISDKLEAAGYVLEVIAGQPTGDQARRSDAADGSWLTLQRGARLRLFGRDLAIRQYPKMRADDILVTELTAKNLVAWRAILTRRRRTVLWGHARSYVDAPTVLGTTGKRFLASRAAAVLTYTPRGREFAIAYLGAIPQRTVSIGNSTDTDALVTAMSRLNEQDIRHLRSAWDAFGPTAMYVGGLDAAKRISFLAEAAACAFNIDPTFRLLVAGKGVDEELLLAGAHEGFIKLLGHADASKVAAMGSVSSQVWMPGRIGLIAADALALGIPVHSIASRFHAPEVDFLSVGHSLILHPDDPSGFAHGALQRTELPSEPFGPYPTLESVATAFSQAVIAVGEGV